MDKAIEIKLKGNKKIPERTIWIDKPEYVIDESIKQFDKTEGNKELILSTIFNPDNQSALLNMIKQDKYDSDELDCDEKKSIYFKSTILNLFYSTRMSEKALISIAQRIYNINHNYTTENNVGLVDYLLFEEKDEDKYLQLVNLIAYKKEENDMAGNCYSFASKYCSWHHQNRFPIFDSLAKGLICRLMNVESEGTGFTTFSINDYSEYYKLYREFMKDFNINSKSFKEVDKYLWKYAKTIFDTDTEWCVLEKNRDNTEAKDFSKMLKDNYEIRMDSDYKYNADEILNKAYEKLGIKP